MEMALIILDRKNGLKHLGYQSGRVFKHLVGLMLLWWVFGSFPVLSAQTLPQGGVNLIDYQKLKTLKIEKDGLGYVISDRAKGPADITLTVENTAQPDFIHNLSVRIPIFKTALKKGDVLLLAVEGKTENASLETGEARSLWVFNIAEEQQNRVRHTLSISSDWKQYYMQASVQEAVSEDNFTVALQFGFPPQKFLLRNLALWRFDESVPLSALPETQISYAGMEPDAPWRKAAEERIENLRKGDFELHFTRKGKPLSNATMNIELKKHHFNWGVAADAQDLAQKPDHLNHVSDAFNLVVFENDLKIKFWNKPGRKEAVAAAVDLLAARGIAVKGHVLIWPGFNHLTTDFQRLKDKPEKVEQLIDRHLNSILSENKGKISRWDVVNEAYTNRDLQEITGSEEILYKGFRELQKRDPEALRYVNEYGIISKGGLDRKKQEWYYDYIKRLDENTGGLVDGIGIQCHMGSDLTPPEKVLSILDYYGELNKKISISEFTMDIESPAIRQQYTADFMTAAFSHPKVFEFLFWGYQGEKADIFKADWEPGAMGSAFFSLIRGNWHSRLTAQTGSDGVVNMRGFYGTYDYSFVDGNQLVRGTFDLLPGKEGRTAINL